MRLRIPSAVVVCTGLIFAALAPSAGATLVYATGGGPVQPPKLPAPEYVWSARNDGSSPQRLAPGSSPSVSPDGKLVAYNSFYAGSSHLAIIPSAGGTAHVLIAAHWQDQFTLAWSPDSKSIVAVLGTELGPKRLVRIDVQTGATLATLARGQDFFGAQFSPDGTRLLYTRAASTQASTDLFVATLATGRIRQLTFDHRSSAAVWGRGWIAFARSRPARSLEEAPKQDVYLMRPDGSGLRRLTHTHPAQLLSGPVPFAWSSDGGRLLAEFEGQDTSYAETVNPVSGKVRRVGSAAQGYVGWGLSRNGRSILATTGGPEQFESNVVSIPYGGGRARVLVGHAHNPDWNA
ncbi:MAG TPA: hypothetical protein VFW38_09155 [Solirubrobacteraceae bacterium]|nr:hypothetical protein [Solirubrobacteraceae bacterium]